MVGSAAAAAAVPAAVPAAVAAAVAVAVGNVMPKCSLIVASLHSFKSSYFVSVWLLSVLVLRFSIVLASLKL